MARTHEPNPSRPICTPFRSSARTGKAVISALRFKSTVECPCRGRVLRFTPVTPSEGQCGCRRTSRQKMVQICRYRRSRPAWTRVDSRGVRVNVRWAAALRGIGTWRYEWVPHAARRRTLRGRRRRWPCFNPSARTRASKCSNKLGSFGNAHTVWHHTTGATRRRAPPQEQSRSIWPLSSQKCLRREWRAFGAERGIAFALCTVTAG